MPQSFTRKKCALTAAAAALVGLGAIASPAYATSVSLRHTGTWSQPIFNPFTGNPIGSVPIWHFELVKIGIWLPGVGGVELLTDIAGFTLEQGAEAEAFLTNLGGGVLPTADAAGTTSIAFDNTMFPDGPGFTTSIDNGNNFIVTFDTPIAMPVVNTEFDLSGLNLVVSSSLDIFNPQMVQSSLFDSTGFMTDPISVLAVPMPSAIALGLVGLSGLTVARRRRM